MSAIHIYVTVTNTTKIQWLSATQHGNTNPWTSDNWKPWQSWDLFNSLYNVIPKSKIPGVSQEYQTVVLWKQLLVKTKRMGSRICCTLATIIRFNVPVKNACKICNEECNLLSKHERNA